MNKTHNTKSARTLLHNGHFILDTLLRERGGDFEYHNDLYEEEKKKIRGFSLLLPT